MEQITKSALLVMDMQSSIVDSLPDARGLISNTAKSIAIARKQDMPVIYVVVGFRAGAPEISPDNKSFSAMGREKWTAEFSEQWIKVYPAIAPQDADIIVVKRRVSAFTGSDLEVVLRGQGIKHMVLTGIATSGVVLSTLREAADKDYQLTVIADCCADRDEEVHRVLTTKVFPRQANVIQLEAWEKGQ